MIGNMSASPHSSHLSSFPTRLWQVAPSLHFSSLRWCITIMASCDYDVLSSGMEMQHATAHIITAECIRCHLCEAKAVWSLRVQLLSGKMRQMISFVRLV